MVSYIRVSFIALRFEMFYCAQSGNVSGGGIKFGRARRPEFGDEYVAGGGQAAGADERDARRRAPPAGRIGPSRSRARSSRCPRSAGPGSGSGDADGTDTALSVLTNTVGALTIARRAGDRALSERILETPRRRIARSVDMDAAAVAPETAA